MRKTAYVFAIFATAVGLSMFSYFRQIDGYKTHLNSTLNPSEVPVFPYQIPKIQTQPSYRIVLVGDSMVAALGANAQPLRQSLLGLYPKHEFVGYNYGIPSQSITILPQLLSQGGSFESGDYAPILNQGFELIIIESYGYNPLSDLPLEKGLFRHRGILEASVEKIIRQKPDSIVAIMATIAPSQEYFATGVHDLSAQERKSWADERIAYIKNAIKFANENNLPLINVYERSLNENGKVNLSYISKDDYIHPSQEGIDLIARTIADFIYQNNIFPR